MASSTVAPVRSSQIRLRHVMFAALLPMFLFVLWHDERWIFNEPGEAWTYFFAVLADPVARTGRIDRSSDRSFSVLVTLSSTTPACPPHHGSRISGECCSIGSRGFLCFCNSPKATTGQAMDICPRYCMAHYRSDCIRRYSQSQH